MRRHHPAVVLVPLLTFGCSEAAPGDPLPSDQPIAGSASGGQAGTSSGGTTPTPSAGTAGVGTLGGTGGTAGNSSAGTNSGGTSGAGGGGGTGGTQPASGCGDGAWTCIEVDGGAPYGSHSFDVPARQNWVNTGLYLRTGQTASITESGSWQVTGSGGGISHGPCKIGDLVARLGLYYEDEQLTCVKGSATVTAKKDGILFLGALAGNDLGETYESRADDSGKKSVLVTSGGDTVPTVLADAAANYAFDQVGSGWVEVWGKHVIMTLPIVSAIKDKAVMARAAQRLDDIYELEAELRSAVPHDGQRIRFFPDGTNPGYMLAGNPVRMDPTLVNGGDKTRISRSGEAGTDIWGFAHEMGHDFSFAPNGFWTYQENTLESWCNLFSIYSLEKLGVALHASTKSCTESSTGNYDGWDAWGGLCFLRQFQFRYGWDFYAKYFESIKDAESTGGDPWAFVHDEFEKAAGEDVTPLFEAWNVPH